ncbi:hypothetical protein [Colwellia psychrerythraea]|uniref:Uncharacterized protein n=1 Tax=Colwellia psychrerythraea TaxID=28229 RepID=A0A099L099_COLPS|nr:hypothetical protein [Colwellia psychrerythraea]KGJ96291.1 hypothetical protein GAB14E_0238 [Colwellia psychrerythraea]
MHKHRLSFADISIISDSIAEIIIDEGVEVSIEMVEEYDNFLACIFKGNYGVLINKINNYSYSLGAQFIMGSSENIVAIAAVNYSEQGKKSSKTVADRRSIDQLNVRTFSGLDLGWQDAVTWLNKELVKTNITSPHPP